MKIEKRVTENVNWGIEEYCCEKMEHTIADENILIYNGQVQLNIALRSTYLKNGNFIDYCPFCGEKIENYKEE